MFELDSPDVCESIRSRERDRGARKLGCRCECGKQKWVILFCFEIEGNVGSVCVYFVDLSWTALMIASRNGDDNVIAALVNAGAANAAGKNG